ncbi:MAG: DUF3794 and LysM peptidoglycan-binding domain-containing protein [Oscillospiraceae bacterium]|jgi:hypothetical protein
MELELIREKLTCFEPVHSAVTRCEETLEAIVPDNLPDVGHIIDACGAALVRGKEISDGKAQVTGVAAVGIIYAPEGGEGVIGLDVGIPFTCSFEGNGLNADCSPVITCYLSSADARLLNPRKILVRAEVTVMMTAWSPQTTELCTGVKDGAHAETLMGEYNLCLVTDVVEKSFTIAEEQELSSARPAAGQILGGRISLTPGESRAVGNKVVSKGTAYLTILYSAESDGGLCTASFELPYSQILELSGAKENAECFVYPLLTGWEIGIIDDQNAPGRVLSITLYIAMQCIAAESMIVNVVSDLYSTENDLTADISEISLNASYDRTQKRQSVREILELPELRSIVDTHVMFSGARKSDDGDVLLADANVTIVYYDNEGKLVSSSNRMPVSLRLESGAGLSTVPVTAIEAYAVPVSGGAEVRFDAEFDISAAGRIKLPVVSGVAPASPGENVRRPAIILRTVSAGESLWDIAKHYGASSSDIIQVNGLDENASLTPGRLLLIPRKRGK